jgi:RimJ/RimL family protein N-acetyltransferase
MITTPRLLLLPADASHYEAVLLGNEVLSAMLGIRIPDKWTEFPEAILVSYDKIKTDPEVINWFFHFIIHRKDNILIGTGGFKGKPDAKGTVEIGYEIIPGYQGKGYATETARALIRHAFSFPEVKKVIAHTLQEYNASVSVLQKLGMRFVSMEKGSEEGDVWRWELTRKNYLAGRPD